MSSASSAVTPILSQRGYFRELTRSSWVFGVEQAIALVVLPTAESPRYVTESDPEKDPEEYKDDETEDGPVDYPMDGGEDGDDDDAIHLGD
ncbi:hypothetical protein Tco_0626168 [Tanacetum coccineum]|uniref:Uncharacterized protein n=1 Tax=Tanacetum coccineum TaxID=301880 RepID=A0ABQ4WIT6_9ASTR